MDTKQIIVYNYDCDEFKGWVRGIASKELNKESARKLLDEIMKKMREINREVIQSSCIQNKEQYDCELVGRGATSICYQSTNKKKQIYKAFSPNAFKCESIKDGNILSDSSIDFLWLSERATQEQELMFLKRFIRFILQSDEIDYAKDKADERHRNLLVSPTLKLSSIGFIYQSQSFCGETLKTVFKYHIENDKIEEICTKLDLVKRAAEYVKKICHDNNIYHGDIKPSNFYAIGDINEDGKIEKVDFIQNIDFDTWVHSKGSNSILTNWDVSATTPIYYYNEVKNIKDNQSFDTLQAYDVLALSRTLIYALLCVFDKENDIYETFENDKDGFDWIEYFFGKSGGGAQLYVELRKREAGVNTLYIFEKIKAFLVGCTIRVKRNERILDIKTFIKKIEEIEKMLKLYGGDHSVEINTDCLRYLGLKRLDAENKSCNKSLQHMEYGELIDQGLDRDWVQYVIEQNYYVQEKDASKKDNNYSKQVADNLIDRHLIPDIELDKGKLLAYEFDKKGYPISTSPLEQALKAVGDKSLFLTAEGGQGKTTSLRSFWLDFLSGKQNMPCIYVDSKLLTGDENVIQKYINEKYSGILNQGSEHEPLLLIDCPNESNVSYREKNNDDYCAIVHECRTFIEDGFRVVVGARSKIIAVEDKNDKRDKDKYKKEIDEFDENTPMQYVDVCKLRDEQIEHCLLGKFSTIKDKAPMINLLRNNMMLHIYMNLPSYGVELSQRDMRAGKLFDIYFDVCFRTRYVRSCLHHLSVVSNLSDAGLYKKLCEDNPNPDSNEKNINDKSAEYNNIHNFLIDNCMESSIQAQKLVDKKIVIDQFENLSILKKVDKNVYVWGDELYQEYFQALNVKNVLIKFHEGEFNPYDIDTINTIYQNKGYNALQFAGELLGYTSEDFDRIAVIVDRIYEDDFFISQQLHQLIVVISSLVGRGTKIIQRWGIDMFAFQFCKNLYQIFIPGKINIIDGYAFDGCCNLKKVMARNIIAIEDGAFNDCHKLASVILRGRGKESDDIKGVYGSVYRIGNQAFANCHSLEFIELEIKRDDRWLDFGPLSGEIGPKAFNRCCGLTHVSLFGNVATISEQAFEDCYNLENLEIYGESIDILDRAFCGCKKLKRINSDKIEKLGFMVFSGCSNLSTIELSSGIKYIGGFAFKGCESLEYIKLPDSIDYIGQGAFDDCKNLTIEMSERLYGELIDSRDIRYRGAKECVVDLDVLNIKLV